ncbi:MAG: SDR family oxidoreductase [Halofilum sp. (in: g-proteobacteria)]|nr:SDR family oxidoreductase [Halofilum sp. (in: g-proteobacteria)]
MKTVLITGASGGIGSAIARRLAADGYRLLLNGRDAKRLEETARACGAGTQCISADLTTAEGRREVVRMAEAYGTDVLINNAGINALTLFEQMDPDTIDAMVTANLLAPVHLTRDLLPHLRTRPGARIVNIGSTFGTIGFPGYVMYSTTKFALRGFSEALGRELADSDVRVQYLAPRATRTGLNSDRADALNAELGNRVDAPERVADAVARILHGRRGTCYLGWPEKLFARINSIAPRLVSTALRGQLGTIKRYADNAGDPVPPSPGS